MEKLMLICVAMFVTSCSAIMPDVAKITHDICDSVVSVEVDRDAFKEDTDVEINLKIVNKDPPKG